MYWWRKREGEERFEYFPIYLLLSLWQEFHLMWVNIIPLILLTYNEIRIERCNRLMPYEAQLTSLFLFCIRTECVFDSWTPLNETVLLCLAPFLGQAPICHPDTQLTPLRWRGNGAPFTLWSADQGFCLPLLHWHRLQCNPYRNPLSFNN